MPKSNKKPSSFRQFIVSALITIVGLGAVAGFMGPNALLVAAILVLVELAFSFDNAIVNAKILAELSPFWRKLFMTLGIIIAVVGMRLLFPIVIVGAATGLSLFSIIDMALYHSDKYAEALHSAHASIASFGGMFLLLLSLQFFFDDEREVRWIHVIERPLQRIGQWWLYIALGIVVLIVLTILPGNQHPDQTFIAGSLGIITYVLIHGLTWLMGRSQASNHSRSLKTGMAGFVSFVYLQILDASFSFDGVIGAFAVTKDVLLIAIGLGIGAVWVRSLTLFMVDRGTLTTYPYLEHGAHYTIAVLAIVLLGGIYADIPEAVAGIAGFIIITASIIASRQAMLRT